MFTGFLPQGDPLPPDWDEQASLSYSVAKALLEKTPAYAYAHHRLLGGAKKKPTDAMIRGTIFDSLLLGIDMPGIVELNFPDFRTKIAQQKRDEVIAAGKTPITKSDLDEYRTVVEKVKPKIGDIFGKTKLRMAWLSGGDVICHGELDSLNEGGVKGEGLRIDGLDESAPIIFDVKSCTCATEAAEDRKIYDLDYQIQNAAYLDGASALRPDLADHLQFVLVFCEIQEPFDVRFVRLKRSFVEMGTGQWERAVSIWRECMRTKTWPGSGRKIHEVGAPPWAYRTEQRLLAEAMHKSLPPEADE